LVIQISWLSMVAGCTALFANRKKGRMSNAVRRAAWYEKPHPTSSDALALVRTGAKGVVSAGGDFCGSPQENDELKGLESFVQRLTGAVSYSA